MRGIWGMNHYILIVLIGLHCGDPSKGGGWCSDHTEGVEELLLPTDTGCCTMTAE